MDVNEIAQPLWQKWTLVMGKIALTLLLSWQLSVIVWQLVAPAPLLLPEPSKGTGSSPRLDIRDTAQYHLFGEASDEEVVVEVPKEVEAPDTRLKLKLLGVTVADPQEESSAIIAPSGRAGDFYRIGDTVQGRTRLSAVYKDKVILDTSGRLETLKFDESIGKGSSVERTAKTKASGNRASKRRNEPRSAKEKPGSMLKKFKAVKSANEFVDLATEEIGDDPQAALQSMGLVPVGSGQGYRVSPGSPLRQFQLKPGDVVLSVNSQPLGDPGSDQQLLQDIQSANSVRIEVQRGNNRFTVNHRLD